MRLQDLRAWAQGVVDTQGSLSTADWLWIFGELLILSDRCSDGLYGVIEVTAGGRVVAWWCS